MALASPTLYRMLAVEQPVLQLTQLAVAHMRPAATANRLRQQTQLLQQASVTTSCLVAQQLQEEVHTLQQLSHQNSQQQPSPQRHYTQQQQLAGPLLSGQRGRAVTPVPPATLCRKLANTTWQQHTWQQQQTFQQQAWRPWQQQLQGLQQQQQQQLHTRPQQAWRLWQQQQQQQREPHAWQQQQAWRPWQQQQRGLHLAPPFLVEDYVPAAVTTYRLGRMSAKLKAAEKVSAADV
jgi:hypothetical protein